MPQKPRISLRAKTESMPSPAGKETHISLETPLDKFLGEQLLSDQTHTIGRPMHPTLASGAHPHYRPKKKQISISLDCDVLEWFQALPGKYQQHINSVCRAYMLANLNQHNMVEEKEVLEEALEELI